jgi:hypothetical protein
MPRFVHRLISTAGEPEDDALLATAVAAGVAQELFATNRQVRFSVVPTRERVAVTLCDADGAVLSVLTPARALEIAAGDALL